MSTVIISTSRKGKEIMQEESDKYKEYNLRKKAFKQGSGRSKYIPMPTEIPFGSIGINNRKRQNARGANPRRFQVQKVAEQVKVVDEAAGEVLVPTGKILTIIHNRTL